MVLRVLELLHLRVVRRPALLHLLDLDALLVVPAAPAVELQPLLLDALHALLQYEEHRHCNEGGVRKRQELDAFDAHLQYEGIVIVMRAGAQQTRTAAASSWQMTTHYTLISPHKLNGLNAHCNSIVVDEPLVQRLLRRPVHFLLVLRRVGRQLVKVDKVADARLGIERPALAGVRLLVHARLRDLQEVLGVVVEACKGGRR